LRQPCRLRGRCRAGPGIHQPSLHCGHPLKLKRRSARSFSHTLTRPFNAIEANKLCRWAPAAFVRSFPAGYAGPVRRSIVPADGFFHRPLASLFAPAAIFFQVVYPLVNLLKRWRRSPQLRSRLPKSTFLGNVKRQAGREKAIRGPQTYIRFGQVGGEKLIVCRLPVAATPGLDNSPFSVVRHGGQLRRG
jgi:hypothetical protein